MRIVCVSDTHMQRPWVPDGDVLIHAGDMTTCGSFDQVASELTWIRNLPHKHKIIIAGNHDWLFERVPNLVPILTEGLIYLRDQCITICGVTFYGSPWTPYFQGWAFNVQRGQLSEKWDRIPDGIDVLITHGPPMGVMDRCLPNSEYLGCAELSRAVVRVRPKVHVFGHIHPGYGQCEVDGIRCINAAHCGDAGERNPPIVIDL